MATASSASPRRAARPSARPRSHRRKDDTSSEPPQKKRKFNSTEPQTELEEELDEVKPERDDARDGEDKVFDTPETPAASRSAMRTRPRRQRPARYAPAAYSPRPRYSNSASAAAASQASDGYKPREERSWEDFHPDLDINAQLLIYTADEVDGRNKENSVSAAIAQLAAQRAAAAQNAATNGDVEMKDAGAGEDEADSTMGTSQATPVKRKPGRPPRRPESMLTGLGSPPAPRIMPLPTHNPKERLNLPKPSFKRFSHFLKFEQDQKENKVNYVDRPLANVGFQESDRFEIPLDTLIRLNETQQMEDEADMGLRLASDGQAEDAAAVASVSKVEYDMDEQDEEWLEAVNEQRKAEGVDAIRPAIFEIVMTQIEKEYHALEKRIPKPQSRHAQMHRPRSSSQAAVNGDPNPSGDEPDSKCSICDDGDCENANAIIFCDGCDLAVHQECYGVPFIPEGQWFCRKCKEVGRGTPTCVFCPNIDGAFKQTDTLRWSHLLCAIWIPEVTIANQTIMEPIIDVDKVPKPRWKLHCYICNQRMGACIQCSNKSCYSAFHVTCARKAKLFLKMKSSHQTGLDTSALKAFCDKHVPPEWRRSQGTDRAIFDAKRWYRHAMKDHKWADNQTIAQELGAPPPPDGGLMDNLTSNADDASITTTPKRKRNEKPKIHWRLPSGAPIVPAVVHETVDASLVRFAVRKRKEFIEKACRYWTLKREARRGAALLKRLQLQLESFSSMEITRRSFVGLAGREKLERRIQFAEILQTDMAYAVELTAMVQEREALRLRQIELLTELVDTVYFPVSPLLQPILQRALKVDEKNNLFSAELESLAKRVQQRYYTSVAHFSRDLSQAIASKLAAKFSVADGQSDHHDTNTGSLSDNETGLQSIHNQLNEVQPGTAEHFALSNEQKELKREAKRLVKAVKDLIEDALRKDAELRGQGRDEALHKLDSLALFSSSGLDSIDKLDTLGNAGSLDAVLANGIAADELDESIRELAGGDADEELDNKSKQSTVPTEPLTPPISTTASIKAAHQANEKDDGSQQHDSLAQGGIPWYLKAFDPVGTTIHEERYSGRDVLRAMSEELSDMDEDTLIELGTNGNSKSASKAKRDTAAGGKKASATKPKAAPKRNNVAPKRNLRKR